MESVIRAVLATALVMLTGCLVTTDVGNDGGVTPVPLRRLGTWLLLDVPCHPDWEPT